MKPTRHQLRQYLQLRNKLYYYINESLRKIKAFDQLFVIMMAILIGIFSGYIASGFRLLIQEFQTLFWDGEGSLVSMIRNAPLWSVILIPMVGVAIVAQFVDTFAKEAKGHGVPEVMNAVATQNGFIRMRVVVVKAFASALSIGSGAAVGREGPIVQIGSAFGSTVGQVFQVSRRRMNTFIGCGAAAGIAATFNAPIAGAIFASEVILGDFSVAAIGPIIISSVFGTVISRSIYGDFPAFIPPQYNLVSHWEIFFYILLGIVAGLIGMIFVRTLYKTEDLFDELNLPVWLKGLIGGGVLGLVAVFLPELMGVGYDTMDKVLSGQLPLLLMILLMGGKVIATSISLGAGASGGVFAPSLFIGSMLGGTMGLVFHTLFPTLTTTSGAYALVGMATMVAATTHAPFTAILIIFEMTTEYTVILPLMVASIIATVITTNILDGNIYTLKLKRRGIDIHRGADVNVLRQLQVKALKQQMVDLIYENEPLSVLLDKITESTHETIYTFREDGTLAGLVTLGMVRRFLTNNEEIPKGTIVRDIQKEIFPTVTDNTPVDEVLHILIDNDLTSIPVVDHNGKLTGQVFRRDILKEYQEMLIQTQNAGHVASMMKYVHKYYYEKVEVLPGFTMARINCPSEFVGQSIKNLHIREKYGIEILIIRRQRGPSFKDVLPVASTILNMTDQLLIFGETKSVEAVCKMG